MRVAKEFAQQYATTEIVGIVFLGAIVRGYFDRSADIDIALFKKGESEISLPSQYIGVEGLEIHCHLAGYEDELRAPWDMAKRWTFSQGRIYYDPQGRIAQLLYDKVPLKPAERKWLLMSGLALSEWYINRLSPLWVERGNLISAHHMFDQGLNYFFDMLFALNNELVADMKWRIYSAQSLEKLPAHFLEGIQETMVLKAFSPEEIERRRAAFMVMWREMMPVVEQEVHLSFEEINLLV